MADEYSFASLSITSSYADEGKREAEEEDMMMPSAEMIILSQFFIGIGVGIHYQGITTKELSRDIIAGLGFVAVVIAIALITLLGASQISDIPLFELFLCFWPGGQAEIAVMTLAAGGSVSIIVLHHIVRIFLVITGAPILHKLKKKRESSNPTI